MIKILFSPQVTDKTITVCKVGVGDGLVINGVTYDFSQLTEGATLPADAVSGGYVYGNVERAAGAIEVPVTLPCTSSCLCAKLRNFPEPLCVYDGEMLLPVDYGELMTSAYLDGAPEALIAHLEAVKAVYGLDGIKCDLGCMALAREAQKRGREDIVQALIDAAPTLFAEVAG